MLLSTEINRTPTKINRAELVPHNELEILGKETTIQGWNELFLLACVFISSGCRVAPRLSLGLKISKWNVCEWKLPFLRCVFPVVGFGTRNNWCWIFY